MGLLSGLLGHSSKTDISKLQQEFGPILIDGEELILRTSFVLMC